MDDRLRTVFASALADMPEPPSWEEVSAPMLTPPQNRGRPRRSAMGLAFAAGVGVVSLVALPLLLLRPANEPATSVGVGDSPGSGPAAVGSQFTSPQHYELRYTQELTLTCEGTETVDNGGFDSFDVDIWVDHQAGNARLGFEYPDGSSHDLILEGRPDDWDRAWGTGTDLGRDAGCRETLEDGSSNRSIAGWAFQDASELWFDEYLEPVSHADEGIITVSGGTATRTGPRTYVFESESPSGAEIRFEYTLDESGTRLAGEERHVLVPGQFEADATIEVVDSGPAALPAGIFDTSEFAPLWGGDPAPTTTSTIP